jgi:hypothetical protein
MHILHALVTCMRVSSLVQHIRMGVRVYVCSGSRVVHARVLVYVFVLTWQANKASTKAVYVSVLSVCVV